MIMSKLEELPNELFLRELFPYLSLIDLKYAFPSLNERFHQLVASFLEKKTHFIHLTSGISCQEMMFIIDSVLPSLSTNQQLKSLEVCQANLFIRFLSNVNRINTNYLNKIIVKSFVDIPFDPIMEFLSKCSQLNEMKLNVLTNVDPSWANGRKWTRWFEKMLQNNRGNILKTLDVCVWCIDPTAVVKFDPHYWDHKGIYRYNTNWKVKLEPDHDINRPRSRQTVEFSRSDQDYLTLSLLSLGK